MEYLIESQPPFLKVGNSMLGIDKQQLENQMHGVADKLTIHCYQERGDRLRYLYGILTKKLTGNVITNIKLDLGTIESDHRYTYIYTYD